MAEQPKKTTTVQRRTYKGKEYLVTKQGKVYDPDTREEQDDLFWNAELNGFQEVEQTTYGLDGDNFEDEEDYEFIKNLDFEIDEEPLSNGFRRIYADDESVISFIKETDIYEDDVIGDLQAMGIPISGFKINHPYTEPKKASMSDVRTVVYTRPETVVDIEIDVFVGFHPSKEEGRPNVLLYPVFWSGQITAVDEYRFNSGVIETRDWSNETNLDLTEPVGYVAINVREDLDISNPDLYPRLKQILKTLYYDELSMDYKTSLKLLQYPAKLYNDIDETFIRTLGFDLPKFKMSNREQVWDFGEEPVAAAVATPEPVVTAVITLPETQEILQNKELKVHPVFGVVMKFTPFTPSGTPKEKKEQTKNEIKTSKPKLQKLMDDLNDLESQFERAGTIVDNLNKRYFEIKADYDRNKDKGLKAEMYRLKEELKPYEIQFDALEQKFQALNILKSTEEFKYETLKTLYETFKEKEGKGIFKIKEGGALKGLDPTKKTEILKYSDPKKAIKNAIQYLKNNIVFSLSTKKTKKYMVQRPDGKWIHFGEMGYEDFTKHQDEKRRDNYLKRTANMKGNWKDDKYSANNLARNILW
jgi:hypothetical protein